MLSIDKKMMMSGNHLTRVQTSNCIQLEGYIWNDVARGGKKSHEHNFVASMIFLALRFHPRPAPLQF